MWKSRAFSSALAIISLVTLALPPSIAESPSAAADRAAESFQAQQLYRKVWELVRDFFYDPTYNDQVWARWEHRYDGKLKTFEDGHKAIETMLVSLGDRYTRFLDRQAFEQEKEQIAARLTGIGIQMGMDNTQRIIVIAPIEGGPAAAAGLMSGDEIAEVNGKPLKGLSLEEASKFIRGPVGSEALVTIVRNKEKKQFRIVRAEIAIKSVHMVKMLNNDVGYIRLGTFMSEVANLEMKEALAKLTPARGLILDLRGNPGGLVNNAVDICGMFLEGGIVVSTVDRNGKMVHTRCTGRPISRQPLVVLIDQGSASASEITSGALRDTGRAALVGAKSFGKGLVQAINKLDDGSGVNLTIARYVTPNNTDINKKGIVPDHTVDLKADDYKQGKGPWWADPAGPAASSSPDASKDIQLQKAVEVLEQKIENASPAYQIKLNVPLGNMWQ